MPPITKLLVANRGEIASRIIRTARRLSIRTVAVYSDPDADAPFVAEADEAVRLPGAAPSETYLNIALIVAAAVSSGADALHPGYGFLSENSGLARACSAAEVVFVGPSPEAIDAMGSKLSAKALMRAAGVPVLSGVEIGTGRVALGAARGFGFPILVKAAFGGGGRGMRVVRSESELPDALASAQREAAAAFGDSTVFVERLVESPRHIEVQVFGDADGNVVHLFERECSIQRRFQKIIEEVPSPAVDDGLRKALGAAAVTAVRALDYIGAATVEFVVDDTGRFYFLEVNTRLQVEHPVTEVVTGLDLVALQLGVAAGNPLPSEAIGATISGHAIEARLYAEDVVAGYMPASGTLHRVNIPQNEGVRVDSGVKNGSVISTYYDAMIAKVIGSGQSREIAARRLADALALAELHGVITNRDLLVRVLRHPEFLAGRTDTGFLVRNDPVRLGRPLADRDARRLHAVAAALAGQAERRKQAAVQRSLPSGWRNVAIAWQRSALSDGAGTMEVRYRISKGNESMQVRAAVTVDGAELEGLDVRAASADSVEMVVAGVRRTFRVARYGPNVWVDSPLGSSSFVEEERFPLPMTTIAVGSLLAPMPGSVVRVLVIQSATVAAGEVLLVLEAMKMEHAVRSPHDGTVKEICVVEGQQVEAGTVLAVVKGDGDTESGESGD